MHTIIITRGPRAACTVLVARQDDGQRDGRDGVLGQDGPDAAHESVGIPHDTSHARGHRQRARRRRDENLARTATWDAETKLAAMQELYLRHFQKWRADQNQTNFSEKIPWPCMGVTYGG